MGERDREIASAVRAVIVRVVKWMRWVDKINTAAQEDDKKKCNRHQQENTRKATHTRNKSKNVTRD